jgi:hypothetical protein
VPLPPPGLEAAAPYRQGHVLSASSTRKRCPPGPDIRTAYAAAQDHHVIFDHEGAVGCQRGGVFV